MYKTNEMKKMNKLKLSIATVGLTALLSGCVTAPGPCCTAVRETRAAVYQPQKVLAVGYGAIGGNSSQYTMGQQKLMTMRAARVDAYRALAEQVYGFRVWGNTAVSAFATQNDNVRTYVDAFIRGARLVNITAVADGNFEATVELDLTPNFFTCISSTNTSNQCGAITAADTSCGLSGCVQPSAYYYTAQ